MQRVARAPSLSPAQCDNFACFCADVPLPRPLCSECDTLAAPLVTAVALDRGAVDGQAAAAEGSSRLVSSRVMGAIQQTASPADKAKQAAFDAKYAIAVAHASTEEPIEV